MLFLYKDIKSKLSYIIQIKQLHAMLILAYIYFGYILLLCYLYLSILYQLIVCSIYYDIMYYRILYTSFYTLSYLFVFALIIIELF